MQCQGPLRRPLRQIIKSIGEHSPHPPLIPTHPLPLRPCPPCAFNRPTRRWKTNSPSPSRFAKPPSTNPIGQDQHTLPGNSQASTEGPLAIARENSVEPLNQSSATGAENPRDGSGRRLNGRKEATREYESAQRKRTRTRSGNAFERIIAEERNLPDYPPSAQFRPTGSEGRVKKMYIRSYQHSDTRKDLERERRRQDERQRYPFKLGWSAIYALLKANTPKGSEHYRRRTEHARLPPGYQAEFKTSAGDAISEVMQRTQSHIQMVPLDHQIFDVLILWGTAAQNAEALKILPELVNVAKKDDQLSSDTSQTPAWRTEFSEPENEEVLNGDHWRDSELDLLQTSLDDLLGSRTGNDNSFVRVIIPKFKPGLTLSGDLSALRPKIWSAAIFTEHVHEITSQVPRLVRLGLFDGPISLTNAVTAELLSLFVESPELAQFFTNSAVDRALIFLLQHAEYKPMRAIFTHLEHCETYKITPSNFDALLLAAAVQGSWYNFLSLVRRMLRCNISPSWKTWAHFHELLSSQEMSRPADVVYREMGKRGMFTNLSALRAVAKQMVKLHFKTIEVRRVPLNAILKNYDAMFSPQKHGYAPRVAIRGRPWLSRHAALFVIRALLSVGRTADAMDVVDKLVESGQTPGVQIVNILLDAAVKGRDPESVIAVLRMMRLGDKKFDEVTYAMIFRLAWRRRDYNMLRVVWHYACASGHVSWYMEDKISRSLRSYVPQNATRLHITKHIETRQRGSPFFPRGDWWFGLAGKYVVGVSTGEGNAPRKPDMMALVTTFSNIDQHEQRRADCKALLEKDFSVWKSLEPSIPFLDALENAWREDIRWKTEEGFGLRPIKKVLSLGPETLQPWTPEVVENMFNSIATQKFDEMLDNTLEIPMVEKADQIDLSGSASAPIDEPGARPPEIQLPEEPQPVAPRQDDILHPPQL